MTAKLSSQEKERFYRIWFVLLHWVNEQLHLVPWLPAVPSEGSVQPEQAMQVRNALWANDRLLTRFITENPTQLSDEDLALVESWQYRLAGNFFVVRALKNYTVLLTDFAPHARAYGVVGLTDSVAETMILPLPVYIQTVLLPFEDRIIYDSLLTTYNVSFGSGIRRSLKEAYRNATEREGILTSLLPTAPANLNELRLQIEARSEKLLQAFRKHLTQTGLSLKMVEQHASTIQHFASNVLLSQTPSHGLLDMTPNEVESYLQKVDVKTAKTSFKRFVRFLVETGRMEYGQAEELRQMLK
ncbi:hypothetical protein KSC_042770 [Ktedonobacter sp. SOSP1-52]|uniref:hypothetical protein n=1 Tax=Ktedonobacter sp. SOSP1-52 TaxID=2778366 RepID=UPI0019168958|nr:hypothetical protein [Ktedonobacter sp. SOSP1-52]GHO65385.1 hypothetical protein KSC_042770 [Ktedonobacter sp. SOSP1-52]